MSSTRQLAELKLIELIDQELNDCNCVSMEYILQKLKSESAATEKKCLEHFQCEKCVEAALQKFPDCFYISKSNNILKTNSINLPNNYYDRYDNCFNIGSAVKEVLTVLEGLLAKLQLYEFLIEVVGPQKEYYLDYIENEFFKKYDNFRNIFKCQHFLIEAIKEFHDIFLIKFYDKIQKYSVYSKYTIEYSEGGLWKVFNSDCLLQIICSTFLQLTAEIQTIIILKEHSFKEPFHFPVLYNAGKTVSQPFCDYFTNINTLKTFISLLPDLFYISRRNRVFLNEKVSNPKTYWYNSNRSRIGLFDCLLQELMKIFNNQLSLYNLAQSLKLKLKKKIHMPLKELDIKKLYCYCSDLKEAEHLKNDILEFSGIFHLSAVKNVLLVENNWNNNGIQLHHKPKSESSYSPSPSVNAKLSSSPSEVSSVNSNAASSVSSENSSIKSEPTESTKSDITIYSEENTKLDFDKKCKESESNRNDTDNSMDESEIFELKEKYESAILNIKKQPLQINDDCNSDIVVPETTYDQNDDLKKGIFTVLTSCGTLSVFTESEGYIETDDGKTVWIIADIVYEHGKHVKNLYNLENRHLNFIAIEEPGVIEDNWKAILVWIGRRPTNVSCAITSRCAWDNIKLLYEKQYKDFPIRDLNPKCEKVKLD
ncbi:uncharacterized protein LOC111623655 isoform X2 [Centruroides sculpturatus]|uniref:uncharacterized protein LOC111623655 isoform X2 n=1 Tax=Centruroides sculpturatus TaxID=218467 RepID=UPI000C6D751F|nr:uncharacterized protein LOC111623655 isoform X2 [Centruroides sculpturatus]